MTHLYRITFSRLACTRTTNHRERRIVAPDLDEAIRRTRAKAERAHPGAIVSIEAAHIYDHTTDHWERIMLYD